jgi:predicted ATP-grasp superfamily ATP-dependent carboligase
MDCGRDARWVVKPDDGAGACNTRVHRTLTAAIADCRRRAARGEQARLEIWEDGDAQSLSLLCSATDVEVLSRNRQRIEIADDGAVRYRGVDIDIGSSRDDAAFARLARDVGRAIPGLAGYVGVDLVIRRDGVPVVIEVNPRVTSAYVGLSAALQRNLAHDVLTVHRLALQRAAMIADSTTTAAIDDAVAAPREPRH